MLLREIISEQILKLDKSNKRLYDKKVLKICHVGKFLSILNKGYSIHRC